MFRDHYQASVTKVWLQNVLAVEAVGIDTFTPLWSHMLLRKKKLANYF